MEWMWMHERPENGRGAKVILRAHTAHIHAVFTTFNTTEQRHIFI
jgi:hypothetical protein